mmetsp:Transcript_5512/g.11578  ORF Transcript_5512/g.11578 Transcript_5512/m.11578 type:complete len:85 (-) Transcript_5512:785-1039(-)
MKIEEQIENNNDRMAPAPLPKFVRIPEITSTAKTMRNILQKMVHMESLHRSQDLLNTPVIDTFSITIDGRAAVIAEMTTTYRIV